jgi:hypothetical protein
VPVAWLAACCLFLSAHEDVMSDLDGVCLGFVYIGFVYWGIQYRVRFLVWACCLWCVCGRVVVMLKVIIL